MNWLLDRLKEKSTWLGVFTLASLFGMKIEPELREYIINAILAVAAVAAFVFKEPAKIPPIELQGRPTRNSPDDSDRGCDVSATNQLPVQPDYQPKNPTKPVDLHNGWNG